MFFQPPPGEGVDANWVSRLVSINGSTLTWEPQLSASGVKNSGYGEHSLHEFFARKIIVYDI